MRNGFDVIYNGGIGYFNFERGDVWGGFIVPRGT